MNAVAQAVAVASAAPLQVCGLTHRYDAKVVLDKVDLALQPGSVLGLIGRNGAGKSTLIRAMLGLLIPESGNAFVFGEPALKLSDAVKERLGFVPQQPDALAWLTAAQMFDYLSRFYPKWDHRFVEDTLKRWKIESNKVMAKLSPGERQRVDLVRALAPQPELLVLDEPTAGLDPDRSKKFVDLIKQLKHTLGLTVLFVTHDLDTLVQMADRVAVLADKQIVADCALSDLGMIDHPFVNNFFHDISARMERAHMERAQ